MSLSAELHIAARDPAKTRFGLPLEQAAQPVEVSPLVAFHGERCITCGKCEAFSIDVVGQPLIRIRPSKDDDADGLGYPSAVTKPADAKAPYFSGNLAQVCPTNALADIPNARRARPWDQTFTGATCTSCAVGCRMSVQVTDDRLTAAKGIDDPTRNRSWLCDKGRYSIEAQDSPARLREPLVRPVFGDRTSELAPATWDDALERAARAIDKAEPNRIGVIGGSCMTNEDQYVWSKFAKGLLATDNVDAQLADGLPAEVVLGSPRVTIDEACAADVVVLLAPDLQEALPVLYLRLRQAVIEQGLKVIEISSSPTAISAVAQHRIAYRAGDAASVVNALLGRGTLGRDTPVASDEVLAAAQLTLATAEDVVVIAGRQSVSESAQAVCEAVGLLVQHARARLLPALVGPNVIGALENGLAPGVLPGRIGLSAGRQWFAETWGRIPTAQGLDTFAMLRAAVRGDIDVLVLLESDPLRDVPDRQLVTEALAAVPTVIVLDSLATDSVLGADVVLPVPFAGERNGTTTNLEGAVSPVTKVVDPVQDVRDAWRIAVELGVRLGADLGCSSLEAITRERTIVASDLQQAILDGNAYPLLHTTTEPSAPVGIDAYAVRLVATPRLYDRSAAVQWSEHLAKLAVTERVRMHPSTLAPLGIKKQGKVRMLNARSSVVVSVLADESVTRGTAVAPMQVPGLDIGVLIDASQFVTNVRVETP